MPLGLMLLDGEEPKTGGPLTFDTTYKKPGGVSLPYFRTKPLYHEDVDVFILRRDPVTGDVYETGPQSADEIPYTAPTHGPHIVPGSPTQDGPATVNGQVGEYINGVFHPAYGISPSESTPVAKPPVAVDPGPDGVIRTMAAPEAQSLTKPLLIAGAILAGLFLLKD